jgi:hypothetical protein
MMFVRELGEFLWAVINNWAGYATGGLIVALVWLWSTVKQGPVSRKFGIGLAILFLFFAVFNAWRDKQHELLALQERLTPKLEMIVSQRVWGGMGPNPAETRLGMVIWLSIINHGAESIAHDYSAKLVFTDGRIVDGIREQVTQELRFPDYIIRNADKMAIYDKTAENPIPRGGARAGIIMFTFPRVVEADMALSPEVILSVKDAEGKITQTKSKISTIGKILQYIPGGPHIETTHKP